jgi:hypothetical protein
MAGITYFVVLPFDAVDSSVVVGDPIECPGPNAAIERAHDLWKVLGHTGAVAFSRTGDSARQEESLRGQRMPYFPSDSQRHACLTPVFRRSRAFE